jgi:ankyrin repeat protein
LLLKNGAFVDVADYDGSTPLHHGCVPSYWQAQLYSWCKLITTPSETDGSCWWWLPGLSAANNAVESVLLLLEHRASIEAKDNDGYTALHHSAFNNSVEVLHRLLKAGTLFHIFISSQW